MEYGEGAERQERDTESEAGSRLWAVSTEPNTGLQLMNREIMTWAKGKRLTDWATWAPLFSFFLKKNFQPVSNELHFLITIVSILNCSNFSQEPQL